MTNSPSKYKSQGIESGTLYNYSGRGVPVSRVKTCIHYKGFLFSVKSLCSWQTLKLPRNLFWLARASVPTNSMSPLLLALRRCVRSHIPALRRQSSTLYPAKLPLAGIRVLDLTRVLAGVCRVPVFTSFSANYFVLAAILYTDSRRSRVV